MKRTIICVVIVALCASGIFGRSMPSKRSSGISQVSVAEKALANKRWPAFIAAFRAAVTKRDRATLRGMILVPFNAQGEILNSADEVFKLIDLEKWWSELKKETAPGARFTSSDVPANWKGAPNPKIEKCARDGIFCFDFATDGRWRLSAQVENE